MGTKKASNDGLPGLGLVIGAFKTVPVMPFFSCPAMHGRP